MEVLEASLSGKDHIRCHLPRSRPPALTPRRRSASTTGTWRAWRRDGCQGAPAPGVGAAQAPRPRERHPVVVPQAAHLRRRQALRAASPAAAGDSGPGRRAGCGIGMGIKEHVGQVLAARETPSFQRAWVRLETAVKAARRARAGWRSSGRYARGDLSSSRFAGRGSRNARTKAGRDPRPGRQLVGSPCERAPRAQRAHGRRSVVCARGRRVVRRRGPRP